MPQEQFCGNAQLNYHFNDYIYLCFIDINILLPSTGHLACFHFGNISTINLLISYDYIIELNLQAWNFVRSKVLRVIKNFLRYEKCK